MLSYKHLLKFIFQLNIQNYIISLQLETRVQLWDVGYTYRTL